MNMLNKDFYDKHIALPDLPFSFKCFVSLFLCIAGLCYLVLIFSIWGDTEMKISYVIEGYGDMENLELIHHSFKYLFWFFGIFLFTNFLLLQTSYSEKLKIFFIVATPLLILSDVGSTWLIRYHDFFAYQLYISGILLALLFLGMFLLIQYELFFKK